MTSRHPILRHIFCQNVTEFSTKIHKSTEARLARCMQNVDLPKGWMEELLALGPNLVYVLASLANDGQITASQIKQTKMGLPSFSYAKWSELAPSLNLPDDLTKARFDSFSIAPVLLPPSFHETTAKAAWHIQDVYREELYQATRIRLFDAVCPTVEFFHMLTLHEVHCLDCWIIPRSYS